MEQPFKKPKSRKKIILFWVTIIGVLITAVQLYQSSLPAHISRDLNHSTVVSNNNSNNTINSNNSIIIYESNHDSVNRWFMKPKVPAISVEQDSIKNDVDSNNTPLARKSIAELKNRIIKKRPMNADKHSRHKYYSSIDEPTVASYPPNTDEPTVAIYPNSQSARIGVYHPYGQGYGMITMYKVCNCLNLQVTIDGRYCGYLTGVFRYGVFVVCGSPGTINLKSAVGTHHVEGRDYEGHYWSFFIVVNEDQCSGQSFGL